LLIGGNLRPIEETDIEPVLRTKNVAHEEVA
jgi:hypothetical protein